MPYHIFPNGGIKSLTCIIFDPTDYGSILRNLDELWNVKFDSLTNVVKAADGTSVVEKVLKKPLTGKKTLSEGLMAKAVGNINSLINAVKTGENSADAIQQAVNGIKAIDITETIKQVELPKKNTVNEVLSKNLDLSEILTEEEKRYYEALRKGVSGSGTEVLEEIVEESIEDVAKPIIKGGSKTGLSDLPENVQNSFNRYEEAGWQGNTYSGC